MSKSASFTLLTSLTFCFLFKTTSAQMVMDMDCIGTELTIMEQQHCHVMALVPTCCATQIAVANGNWFSGSTWSTGTVPLAGENVYIPEGYTVTYNGSSNEAINWIRVNGVLNFATNMNTKLFVGTLVVDTEGKMTMGTFASPIASNYTCEIIFADQGPINTIWDPYFFSKGMVMQGEFESYGAYKKSFTEVNSGLSAGSNKLTLASTPTGWKVGDKIVLAGTYSAVTTAADLNNWQHDEELIVTSISGSDIYFQNVYDGGSVLLFDHNPPAGYGLKVHVANLTRNVSFKTENYAMLPSSERGHCMFMHTLNVTVNNTAFIGLGRTDKNMMISDPVVNEMGELVSGGENPRGRYACHFHHGGPSDPTVTPAYVYNCVVDGTPGWGFVNHQSFVNMDNNVAYNFRGSAFVSEDGNEIGSMTNNIAIKGLVDKSGINRKDRIMAFDMGFDGTGFWMQSPNIDYANNVAVSCGGSAFSLFSDDDDLPPGKRYLFPTSTLSDPSIAGGEEYIYQGVIPIRSNTGSIAYNSYVGFSIWTHMKNSDDIGNFSISEYSPYTHNKQSVIENFKFWNIYATGIDISYSSQVTFKNGLLLGDLANRFDGIESADPAFGYAFHANTNGSSYYYDNLQVEGWKYGAVVFRSDDQFVFDDEEYNFHTSKIIGGHYTNITYPLHPEEGYDYDFVNGYYIFPKYFEISGDPVITSAAPDSYPIADFTFSQIGNNTLQLNAGLSYDTDPAVSSNGSGIAAYVWTLPGGTNIYGMDPCHQFPAPGTYSVTLKVYDCKGQASSITKNVLVENTEYTNCIINSGFEDNRFSTSSSINSTKSAFQAGWFYKGAWINANGKMLIGLSPGYQRTIVQTMQDDYIRKGIVEFSFQAKNQGTNTSDNSLIAEVYGVNSEFEYNDASISGGITKWNNNDMAFTADLLFQEEFGNTSYGWQTFKRDVDFGDGYKFIVVRFASQNLKAGQQDTTGLDNICLPCVCDIPGGGLPDELTSTSARLIWDNVGAESYLIQYKQGGGTWTTDTVSNTFFALTDLTPGTLYVWRISALCDGAYTAYSANYKFTTPELGSECTSPVDLSVSYITNNAATFNWNAVPGAINYKLSYKSAGSSAWTTIVTNQNSYRVTGLSSSMVYNWRVRSECAEGWKPNSGIATFTTLSLKEALELGDENNILANMYPNPADEVVQFMMNCESEQEVTFKLYDLSGKLILTKTVIADQGVSVVQVDISEVAAGTYLVKANSDEMTITDKLIIY